MTDNPAHSLVHVLLRLPEPIKTFSQYIFGLMLLFLLTEQSVAQLNPRFEGYQTRKQTAFTVGYRHGGSTLLGAELHRMPGQVFGWHIGGGYLGVGGGFNIHFRNEINSSAIGFSFIQEGEVSNFRRQYVTMHYLLRTQGRFESSLGMGVVVNEGPGLPRSQRGEDFVIRMTIGMHFSR